MDEHIRLFNQPTVVLWHLGLWAIEKKQAVGCVWTGQDGHTCLDFKVAQGFCCLQLKMQVEEQCFSVKNNLGGKKEKEKKTYFKGYKLPGCLMFELRCLTLD